MHGRGSRNKLTPGHARLYPGDGVLDRLGRAICTVECLPRKELHEAWEMAQVVRTAFGYGPRSGRVVDLCSGYGLLAQVLLVVDETLASAVAVDARLPPNHQKVHRAVLSEFPALGGRIEFLQARLETVALRPDDLVVSSHACASLTDRVLERASDVGARVAVLPCCHWFRYRVDLVDHEDPALAIDLERVDRLRAVGYSISTLSIPEDVTPKNRLLIGERAS